MEFQRASYWLVSIIMSFLSSSSSFVLKYSSCAESKLIYSLWTPYIICLLLRFVFHRSLSQPNLLVLLTTHHIHKTIAFLSTYTTKRVLLWPCYIGLPVSKSVAVCSVQLNEKTSRPVVIQIDERDLVQRPNYLCAKIFSSTPVPRWPSFIWNGDCGHLLFLLFCLRQWNYLNES